MFMTDHELIYGKSAGQSGAYTDPVYAEENKENKKHSSEFMKKTGAATVAAAKLTGKAAVGAAKTASNAAAKFTKNAADYLKSDDAAEKMNFLKGKAKSAASGAGSMLSGIKNKAADKMSERKNMVKSSDENIPAADEYDAEDNYNVSSDETAYQNDDEYTPDSIADEASFEDVTDENEPPLTEIDNTVQYQETTSAPHQSNNASFPDNSQNRNYQQPQSHVPLQSGTPSYVIQKQKTNPVLIIVIIILVLIIGILGGMFFMMSRDKRSDKPDKSSTISEVEEINTEATETPTESKTKTTTAEKTTSAETTTTTATTTKAVSNVSPEEVNTALAEYLNGYTLDEYSRNPEYSLLDVNSDGVPELFIRYENQVGTTAKMYLYKNSTFNSTNITLDDFKISQSENIIQNVMYGGGSKYSFYQLDDFGQLDLFDELTSYAGQYYRFENSISEKEFNDYLSDYNNHYMWCVPDFTAFKAANQAGNNENQNKIPNQYIGYENIGNAPSDMEFYDANNTITGYVRTEFTGLNLRTTPSTDSEKILEIPKDSDVEILGANSEWYYVKWTVYAAGLKQDLSYYGFVSRQFISSN